MGDTGLEPVTPCLSLPLSERIHPGGRPHHSGGEQEKGEVEFLGLVITGLVCLGLWPEWGR
jgi:hypothetical protein